MDSNSEVSRGNEDSAELFQLAGQIDSTLDSSITSLFSNVRIFNAFLNVIIKEFKIVVGLKKFLKQASSCKKKLCHFFTYEVSLFSNIYGCCEWLISKFCVIDTTQLLILRGLHI